MEERAEFLIPYAEEHGPVTVRQLYYQAEVTAFPASTRPTGLLQDSTTGPKPQARRSARL